MSVLDMILVEELITTPTAVSVDFETIRKSYMGLK